MGMKVLVVGGGGREHALVWKIAQSHLVSEIFCAPGNAGITQLAECLPIGATDIPSLVKAAKERKIDLTVVGPEVPLALGVVDKFKKQGFRIFGVSQRAVEIESSKVFAKDLMRRYRIPTAEFWVFDDPMDAKRFVKARPYPYFIKADGLAAGKGSKDCPSVNKALQAIDEIMVKKEEFGEAGNKIVIEEVLEGEEATFKFFTDGQIAIPMPTTQDHKRIYDGDRGLNTGGMGAYSPAPVVTEKVHQQVMAEIVIPTIRAMAQEGRTYKGVLYIGLMIKHGKAQVLEFNGRFGDPEAQPILMRMKNDLVPLLMDIAEGRPLVDDMELEWDPRAAVCVVMASGGYPGSYEKGKVINGLDEVASMEDVEVFHAGTALKDGQIVTAGGRVLGVTALGNSIAAAISRAYEAVDLISWEGEYHRRDIGQKALRYWDK